MRVLSVFGTRPEAIKMAPVASRNAPPHHGDLRYHGRDTSERIEAIEAGVARLVGTDPAAIVAAVDELLDDEEAYALMTSGANPFGGGHASERIVKDLMKCQQQSKPSRWSDLDTLDFRPRLPLPHVVLT